jgi:hypothetical protein
MHCGRCNGLMLHDRYLGLDGQLPMLRCANCGAIVDAKIRQHQLRRPADKARRPRHHFQRPSPMTSLLLCHD